MTQIICLANSWKFEERCIAGINPTTGQWIRPVFSLYPEDDRVPVDVRLIQGKELASLASRSSGVGRKPRTLKRKRGITKSLKLLPEKLEFSG